MEPAYADSLLAVARCIRPHGIRGELSAMLLAPAVLDPADLLVGRVFLLRPPSSEDAMQAGPDAAARPIAVEAARPHQDRWLIKLAGVDTMNDAELLRGHDLCLARRDLPTLPEGWFWDADIRRCRVEDARLGALGQAAGLDDSGYQTQLLLRRAGPDGQPRGPVVQIPWVRAYVASVDPEAGLIRLTLPEGYPGLSDAE